jgi:hypothetical protein
VRETFYDNSFDIKPEVLICIAWADSALWHKTHSKTPGNWMNYLNTDSGHWADIEPRQSVRYAAYDMSYWTYMWGHDVIGTMSNGGRKNMGLNDCHNVENRNQKCYATSEYNWNVNVLNCLSYIENQPIREDYNIRK